jgi:hypothetical protein
LCCASTSIQPTVQNTFAGQKKTQQQFGVGEQGTAAQQFACSAQRYQRQGKKPSPIIKPSVNAGSSSLKAPDVYVLGDASAADEGEKSGLSAGNQAIRCASHLAAIVG